jgi:hypothetical protein
VFAIAKGMISGAWAVMAGWVLPSGITLLLLRALVMPTWGVDGFGTFFSEPDGEEGASLLVWAVVLGWLLSAVSIPLYWVLEGYVLWPRWLKDLRRERHRHLRATELRKASKVSASTGSVDCAWTDERLGRRYPLAEGQVQPTRLGNAIRSFECYGQDRYQLDTVRLWPHLTSAVPGPVTDQVNEARTRVDFFVCLLYTQLMLGLAALVTMVVDRAVDPPVVAAAGIGFVVAGVSYRGAIAATNAWSDAVRAVVDLGRLPLAAAMGLSVPDRLEDERRMWQTLCWSVGYPYSPEGAKRLNEFRSGSRGAVHDSSSMLSGVPTSKNVS